MVISSMKPVIFISLFVSILLVTFTNLPAQEASNNEQKNTLPAIKEKKSPPPDLKAGNIRVELPLQKAGKNFARGSYAFAEIKIFNENPKRYAGGELVLEADGLRIQTISALDRYSRNKLRIRNKKKKKIARFRKLSNRKPLIIWVELKLNEQPDSISNLLESKLKITLHTRKNRNTLTDSTAIRWSVANCAASYHTALISLNNNRLPTISNALKEARGTIKLSKGKWLFKPAASYDITTKKVSKCKRYKRYWNRQKGRWSYSCRAYKTITKNVKTLTPEAKKLKELQKTTSAIVYARGKLPAFRNNTGDYWVTKKISSDLKRYLTQKASPVMCTGAVQMTEYYNRKFKQVRTRAEEWKDNLIKAQKLAVLNIEVFINTMSQENTGTFSKERLQKISHILEKKELSDKQLFSSDQLLNNLLKRINNNALNSAVSDQTEFYPRFTALNKYLKTFIEETQLPEIAQKKLNDTLFLIETVYHLELARDKYSKVITSFDNNMNGIREAHKKHCTCAS